MNIGSVWEELQSLHHRLSILLRSQVRESSHASMEGRSSPEEYAILKELSGLKPEVEWHLIEQILTRPPEVDLRFLLPEVWVSLVFTP